MVFLRFLESVRNPFLDAVMSAVTFLGDEVFFTAAALFVFWCVSKRRGYFIFAVGLIGGGLSQIMKLYFRVPRPWVTDPGLTIVESARNGAGGYSFPSGHAQSAVGTLGSAAVSSGRKAV
ncbi:MAG: phosphatase PAP2 family protein, partial [Oscillospiraceae bacterium]|nr:phosphatase PAP2 family protein [Oscillospiraceae bacterium]